MRVVEVDNSNLVFEAAQSPEAPIVLSRPASLAFQPALLNEAPRSSEPRPKLAPAPAPAPAKVPASTQTSSLFQPNSVFRNFQPLSQAAPAVFQQSVDLRAQPQTVRVAPPPPRPRLQPQPAPAPVQRRPPPQPVQVRPRPQVVRQPPQPVAAPAPAAAPQRRPAPAAAAPVRSSLFPSFELPDFFTIPFVAFRSLGEQTRTRPAQAAPGGALFNSIGH